MAYKDDKDFSKKSLSRSKRLYEGMEKAHKTHDVRKEMAAEKKYYGDKQVSRQGKKQYEDVKSYMVHKNSSDAKAKSDSEMDKVYRRKSEPKKRVGSKMFYNRGLSKGSGSRKRKALKR